MILRVIIGGLALFVLNGLCEATIADLALRTITTTILALVFGVYLLLYGVTQS